MTARGGRVVADAPMRAMLLAALLLVLAPGRSVRAELPYLCQPATVKGFNLNVKKVRLTVEP